MPDGSGLGATTNGCRPISVKIQPAEFAMKGAAIPHRARRERNFDCGTVPFRVTMRAKTAAAAASAPKPIMMRKPQYVTNMDGW
jgi:pyruvate/2-oxoglutarate/acetoin dehydrogenase E1 component